MLKTCFIILALSAVLVSCSNKEYDNFNPDTTIILTAASDSTPADNVSYLQITAKVDSNIANANRSIVFTSNQGTFANTTGASYTTQIASNETAVCFLKNSVAGPTTVIATISSGSTTLASTSIVAKFDTAWPNYINLSLSPADTIKDTITNTIAVTATLARATGTPSNYLPITFYDSTSIGSIGTFINQTPTTMGATATYWFKNTNTFQGFLFIKGKIKINHGQTLTGANILIVEKK